MSDEPDHLFGSADASYAESMTPTPAPARRTGRVAGGFRSLRHRDFALFLSGQLVSLVGTWMQSVGQSWLVLELTNSAFKLGLVGALQFGPMLVFSLVAGAVADRLPKRRLILGTQTALMLQAFALSALTWSGAVQYWHVALLAFLYGMANTLDMPARQAFIVEMVGKEDLTNAIALNSTMFNGARVVGPAAAGLLIDRYGVPLAFALNGLSFLAVIAALAAMRTEGRPHVAAGSSVREDIAIGLRYAFGTPLISMILSLLLVVSLFVVNHSVLVPLLARDVLRVGAHGFGLLMAAVGSGAVIGALALATLAHEPPVPLLIGAGVASAAFTLTVAFVRSFWLAAAVLALIGLSQIIFMASCNTLLQITVPDRLRGRIMSFYAFVFVGVTPFGSLFVGAAAQMFGVSVAYGLGGGVALILVIALALHRWRATPKTLDDVLLG